MDTLEKHLTETIYFEPKKCSGCRACELACSFRLNKKFSLEGAAIAIYYECIKGASGMKLKNNCDLCSELRTPMCIEFCSTGALTLGRK